MLIPEGKVAIISHDAGGAEIVSSWLRRNPREYVAVIDGPAKDIFKSKNVYSSVTPLNEAIDNCNWVLSGSGISNFEYKAILEAKNRGVYVVSYMDHWTAYRERFVREGIENFPDEIWVGDEDALKLVNKKIPQVKSNLVPNSYWMDTVEGYSKLKSTKVEDKVLYVSTNLDDFHRVPDSTVFDELLLEKIVEFIQETMVVHNKTPLTIRRHPSEKIDKYRSFCSQGLNVSHDSDNELIKSIAKHTHIMGFNSMALVLGKLCGKYTVNFLFDDFYGEIIPDKYIDQTVRLIMPKAHLPRFSK